LFSFKARAETKNLDKNTLLYSAKILNDVMEFRRMALSDYKEALTKFGSLKVVDKFKEFDKYLWPVTNPRLSWSYFFNVSVYAFGDVSKKNQVVGFYHPWSDVFLVMDWKLEKGDNAVIQDAEVVVGDWIRNNGNLPFDPIPAWLRKNQFKVTSLGIATAEAVRAFEKLFNLTEGNVFRNTISSIKDKELLEDPNYYYAAAALLNNLIKIENFGSPGIEEDKNLTSLRKETNKVNELAAQGRWNQIFSSANYTLPETKEMLKKMPSEIFKSLKVVDFYLGNEDGLVFLVPVVDSGYCLSFLYKGKGGKYNIKRIDIVNFSEFYKKYVLLIGY
jgi:hypothetical protein